jgi:anthranilate/para-aminobenzoate synthase component I
VKKNTYLEKLYNSNKPLIIYKVMNGYNIYTDFSEKLKLNSNNINNFFKKIQKLNKKKKNIVKNLYIGFFGYRLLCGLINLKIINQRSINFPDGVFYKPQTIVKIRKKISIKSNLKNYHYLFKKSDFVKTNILTPFKVNLNYKKYKKIFYKFTKNIKEGKTYQIKICTKYTNKSKINPVIMFWKLMKTSSASESFMIRDKNYSIVSCSPETLIEKKGDFIKTKPIAGTMRKNKKTNLRKALHFFKNNIKETKEHNMIVDMERSDLSKICKFNSVKITKLKFVEEHKHLYHYVSEIKGKLIKNTSTQNIIKAMMPGGSVIGCPKISTLNLLNQQEKDNRNIFTGSFGYINSRLDMRFNIIIRSILNYKNKSEISVASGVVIDSTPKKEFNENYIKAKSLLNLF